MPALSSQAGEPDWVWHHEGGSGAGSLEPTVHAREIGAKIDDWRERLRSEQFPPAPDNLTSLHTDLNNVDREFDRWRREFIIERRHVDPLQDSLDLARHETRRLISSSRRFELGKTSALEDRLLQGQTQLEKHLRDLATGIHDFRSFGPHQRRRL